MWISPVSLGEWKRIKTFGFHLPRLAGISNMAMGEGFTAQKKMLPVALIFVLYFLTEAWQSAGSSIRSQWDQLMRG
jgi:hypothetical protein